MAARVLLQPSAVAPVTATLILGSLALRPQTAYAEAPSRKPIYDDVEALPATVKVGPVVVPAAVTTTTIAAPPAEPAAPTLSEPTAFEPATSTFRRPTPTDRLAAQIGKARLFIHRQAVTAEDAVNAAVDSTFNLEQSFTSTVASLAPRRDSGERLMPGAVYVLVAAMAGSIVARNRGVFLRATAPLAFGVGAGWVVLPITMNNVSNLAWKYEQRFPALASTHLKVRDSVEQGVRFAKVHKDIGLGLVDQKVTTARETVEGWVRRGT